MELWTWTLMLAKIKRDLDLEDETFVTDVELLAYANEGIDEVEANIHNLNEDYFMSSDLVSLVTSTSAYDMPTDIYAHKIRAVHYDDGSGLKYDVRRIKIKDIPDVDTSEAYRYRVTNTAAAGAKFTLYPTSRETSALRMTRFYIRNAKKLTTGADYCDVPEFAHVVINFVKVAVASKEMHPQLGFFQAQLEKSRALMLETLSEMVPDEDNDIELDLSHYEEMA